MPMPVRYDLEIVEARVCRAVDEVAMDPLAARHHLAAIVDGDRAGEGRPRERLHQAAAPDEAAGLVGPNAGHADDLALVVDRFRASAAAVDQRAKVAYRARLPEESTARHGTDHLAALVDVGRRAE